MFESQETASFDPKNEDVEQDTQPSDEELLAHVRSIPIPKGWKLTVPEMILPLSVTEMWDIIWSDDGIYDLDKALEHFGDKYGDRVAWEPAKEGQTWKHETVIATKTVDSKSKLPSNPL